MGLKCICQLSEKPTDYIYAIVEDNYVIIVPKNDYHWKKGIPEVLIDKCVTIKKEVNSIYAIDQDQSIKSVMKSISIDYSKELQNIFDGKIICNCKSCVAKFLLPPFETGSICHYGKLHKED